MDDAVPVPQSIFVVVSWDRAPWCISIVQLETQKHDHEQAAYLTGKKWPELRRRRSFSTLEFGTQLSNEKEYVAHFSQPEWSYMHWMVSPPLTSSTKDLYMLPCQTHENDVPLHGCVFDFRTKTHRPIHLPTVNIKIGHVVTLGGCIYVISRPNRSSGVLFMRYDPAPGEWERRAYCPGDAANADCIMATAVWETENTVLFNMDGREFWAYDVMRDRWYGVHVKSDKRWCYSIEGEAVVLGNTIYALTTQSSDSVLALSIQRGDGDHGGFVCSLRCQILLDINPISVLGPSNRTRHLVHLGKDSFCIVKCGQNDIFYDSQPIQLTNIKFSEENSEISMTVIDECVYLLRVPDDEQFTVKLCFSLPECKTTALKEGKNFCFNLDPYPKDFDPKEIFKTDDSYSDPGKEFETLPKDGGPLVNVLDTSELLATSNATCKASMTLANGAATETIYIDAEGNSFSIRNLSSDATFGQFDLELKKFGASERFEILFKMDDKVSAIITEGWSSRDGRKEKNRSQTRRNNATKKQKKSKKKVGN